ncbi:MAG: hypothetical protein ABJA76_18375, partial [Mucilaginibacter sp.]
MIKRFFLVLILLLAALFAGIYIYIPSTISANGSMVVITAERHTADFLTTYAGWKAWWPGEKSKDEKTYRYRGNTYRLTRLNNSGASLVSVSNNTPVNANITFIGVDKESTRVTWTSTLITSSNPLKRIKQYEEIAGLTKNLDELLQRLKQFLDDDKNVYHIGVKVQKVKDSVILTTNTVLKQTPDVQQVYKLIAALKQQVEQQHGVETSPPMLNVHQSGINEFEVMVGIPISKSIKTDGQASIHKMVLGNILVAEVKGGLNTV